MTHNSDPFVTHWVTYFKVNQWVTFYLSVYLNDNNKQVCIMSISQPIIHPFSNHVWYNPCTQICSYLSVNIATKPILQQFITSFKRSISVNKSLSVYLYIRSNVVINGQIISITHIDDDKTLQRTISHMNPSWWNNKMTTQLNM